MTVAAGIHLEADSGHGTVAAAERIAPSSQGAPTAVVKLFAGLPKPPGTKTRARYRACRRGRDTDQSVV